MLRPLDLGVGRSVIAEVKKQTQRRETLIKATQTGDGCHKHRRRVLNDAFNVEHRYYLRVRLQATVSRLIYSIRSLYSPIIGGVLSVPAPRWPDTLGKIEFLREHPYFLPSATAALIAFLSFTVAFLGLREASNSFHSTEKHLAKLILLQLDSTLSYHARKFAKAQRIDFWF